MSQPVLDLTGVGNWSQVYDESRTAVLMAPDAYIPIPAFEVGVLIESPILAVRAFCQSAKPTWRFGGLLIQRFQIGTGGAASPLPLAEASDRALRVNRTQLIVFPKLTANYELLFTCPYWFPDCRLTVWEYSGVNSDTTEKLLELIQIDLNTIEVKIDNLS